MRFLSYPLFLSLISVFFLSGCGKTSRYSAESDESISDTALPTTPTTDDGLEILTQVDTFTRPTAAEVDVLNAAAPELVNTFNADADVASDSVRTTDLNEATNIDETAAPMIQTIFSLTHVPLDDSLIVKVDGVEKPFVYLALGNRIQVTSSGRLIEATYHYVAPSP